MRRAVVVLLVVLAAAPAAHAATIAVSPQPFSPRAGRVAAIDATLTVPRVVGVQLATASGTPIGWIERPGLRTTVSVAWDGRLDGKLVRDGFYRVRLLVRGKPVALAPLRIDRTAPELLDLAASNGGPPFAGDRPLLTTISPNGDGFRDNAAITFRLSEPATVRMTISRTVTSPKPVYTVTEQLAGGPNVLTWTPPSGIGPRTYLVQLSAVDTAGNRHLYGADNARSGRRPTAPVIRVQGVDAGFGEPSYAPGQLAGITVSTDAPALSLQFFQSGPERVPTYNDSLLNGVPVSQSLALDWRRWRDAPHRVQLRIGDWPSGLYYAQLTSSDGRVGYAPFVVRPPTLGGHRILVVLPTSTWQAYNFQDGDGDGWGDTWYAGPPRSVQLGRPFLHRGVPPFFDRYDLGFLHWLYWTGKQVDFVADTDLDTAATGDDLAAAYDLIVFPGHTEYVDDHQYDVVQRYRDLGGNLMFLSANNFFWHVDRTGDTMRRTAQWRNLGRPEAALIGVEYRGNDEGQHQAPYVVRGVEATPWLFDGTGLADGSLIGQTIGGYGIEIDATTPQSPPGTQVLAEIPDLLGPGFTAQMSYYETPAGAKVFAAGAMDFGGSATLWELRRFMDNLWGRLSQP